MEKVRPWCGQPSDRGRLKNRTERDVVHMGEIACIHTIYFYLLFRFSQSSSLHWSSVHYTSTFARICFDIAACSTDERENADTAERLMRSHSSQCRRRRVAWCGKLPCVVLNEANSSLRTSLLLLPRNSVQLPQPMYDINPPPDTCPPKISIEGNSSAPCR